MMHKSAIQRVLDKVVESEGLETERNILFNYSNSEHGFVVFDPTNPLKKGKGGMQGNVSLYCMFQTTEFIEAAQLKRKMLRQMQSHPDNPVVVLDLNEDVVYIPQAYDALPGKKIADGVCEYLAQRDDVFSNETRDMILKEIASDARWSKRIDDTKDPDLAKMQEEYLGLSVQDAKEKAEKNGLVMVVVFEDGAWNREVGQKILRFTEGPGARKSSWNEMAEHQPNRFAVFVFQGTVVAISHESDDYTDSPTSGRMLIFG